MATDKSPVAVKIDPGAGTDAIGVAQLAVKNAVRSSEEKVLERARRVAAQTLKPNAQRADLATGPLTENFAALAEAGLLGLAIPKKYGGLDTSSATQRKYTEILAAACGVTTFVQAQHHGSSRMIAASSNETLKSTILPLLASGFRMCAISFAHLRRPGPPVLRAVPVKGGIELNGTAPWVTGWGLMDQIVFGATLPDGGYVYVWTPADRSAYAPLFTPDVLLKGSGGLMAASSPIPLCTMNASATVELTLADWFVPEAHILNTSDRETMQKNDMAGVLSATAMPLGCARAACEIVRATAVRRSIPAIERAANSLEAELEELGARIDAAVENSGDPDFFVSAVMLRAWCIEFALRAAHAAITAVSGSANALSHPAQRLLREAMFYTVQAQTQDVMDATLARLERRGGVL
jgi:alkylation response protein AidB-like acyl-CoA dehydrogenase